MPVYRLDPIGLSDPNWQASSVMEMVFASAETPLKARELVAAKTGKVTPAGSNFHRSFALHGWTIL